MQIHELRPVTRGGQDTNEYLVDVTLASGRVRGVMLLDCGGSDFVDMDGQPIETEPAEWEALSIAAFTEPTSNEPVELGDD